MQINDCHYRHHPLYCCNDNYCCDNILKGKKTMFMSDVSVIVRKMRLIAEANLGKYDIGFPEQLVIMYLGARGASNQTAIADRLEIDKGSITKTTSKLEAKGLIIRKANPNNRRENRIELSPAGQEILQVMRSAHEELNEAMFAGLSKEEINATSHVLSIIADNLVRAEQDKAKQN